jgi:hypothetical protein
MQFAGQVAGDILYTSGFWPRVRARALRAPVFLGSLTLFYTRGLGIVVLHVMVPEPYRFPLCFFK